MNIKFNPHATIHLATWQNPRHLMVYLSAGLGSWWVYLERTKRRARPWSLGVHLGTRRRLSVLPKLGLDRYQPQSPR